MESRSWQKLDYVKNLKSACEGPLTITQLMTFCGVLCSLVDDDEGVAPLGVVAGQQGSAGQFLLPTRFKKCMTLYW
jgi:hypothetical protein